MVRPKSMLRWLACVFLTLAPLANTPTWADTVDTPLKLYGLGRLDAVAYSPDGRHIAIGGTSSVQILDLEDASKVVTLPETLYMHKSLAFSSDGAYVLTGSKNHDARLWNATSGTLVRTFSGHSSTVGAVAFSPDGSKILTGSPDHTARLWDAATGVSLCTLTSHTETVAAVAFSPDGGRFLTGSEDGTAVLWDTATSSPLRVFTHPNKIISVAFSPDGSRILTAANDAKVREWNAATGEVVHTISRYGSGIYDAAYSPNGTRLAIAMSYSLNLWKTYNGELVQDFANYAMCNILAYSPDGSKILTGGNDKTARIWDAATGEQLRQFSLSHTEMITTVDFSPDGNHVLTGAQDSTARVWDTATALPLRTLAGTTSYVNDAAYSPDGGRILIGSGDCVELDAGTGGLSRTFIHPCIITAVTYSPDGSKVLTGGSDFKARIWDTATSAPLHTLTGHIAPVLSVAFSSDGAWALTGAGTIYQGQLPFVIVIKDNRACLWNAATGEAVHFFSGHTGQVRSVAFSPDGSTVLTGSDDGTARLWDRATGDPLRTLQVKSSTWAVAFSPDGRKVLTGSSDGRARLWHAATGNLLRTYVQAGGRAVAFSPDGTKILTGGDDGVARLWSTEGFNAVSPASWRYLE